MRNTANLLLLAAIVAITLVWSQQTVQAQSPYPDGAWSEFVDIANTSAASTYPCIAADAAGNIHVLWSEDVGGKTSNLQFNPDGSPQLNPRGKQSNYLTNDGNTLYYTRWDGKKWLDPVDVQINSSGVVQYPRAVVDLHGILHVVWVAGEGTQTRLYYSQAPAGKAESAHEWSVPTVLAEPVLYAYYPADISTDPTGGIHVIYSDAGTEQGTYVINSYDGGGTWSAPIELYRTYDVHTQPQEGVSTIKLIVDHKGRLHATWTRFGTGGDGKAIYYSQSQDRGRTWSRPFEVAAWQPGWYEVDWLSAGVTGDEIHLVWEGSSSVAALNERISLDGGRTWSGSHRILSKLVGENGFADLVVDSANQLHMLYVQRGDPSAITHGVWYTSWDKDHWQDPVLLGTSTDGLYAIKDQLSNAALLNLMKGTFTGNGLRYPMAAIVNGNELFVVVPNEYDGDIWSSHATLAAPDISPQLYPQPTAVPAQVSLLTPQAVPAPASTSVTITNKTIGNQNGNAGDPVLVASLPVLLIIVALLIYTRVTRHPLG